MAKSRNKKGAQESAAVAPTSMNARIAAELRRAGESLLRAASLMECEEQSESSASRFQKFAQRDSDHIVAAKRGMSEDAPLTSGGMMPPRGRTPAKDDYPLEEQEADRAAVDQARADLAAGRDWILPKAVSDAMLDDDDPAHPVKAWRRYRGLTIAELGKKAGVSPQTVNMIERGHRTGRGSTLAKLAAVLDCRIEDLVE